MTYKTLEVRFTCQQCSVVDAVAFVPVRKPGQDVVEWMKVCTATVCECHQLLSPNCHPSVLKELKIPHAQKGVGFHPDDRDDAVMTQEMAEDGMFTKP